MVEGREDESEKVSEGEEDVSKSATVIFEAGKAYYFVDKGTHALVMKLVEESNKKMKLYVYPPFNVYVHWVSEEKNPTADCYTLHLLSKKDIPYWGDWGIA